MIFAVHALLLAQVISGHRRKVFTPSGPCGSYAYCEAIVVDHTKLGSSDLTSFPVLIVGSSNTEGTGSGGHATNANGYDVTFYPTNSCSGTKLNWETEIYSASSTSSVWWILPTVTISHTSDTTIGYRCIGNASVTTDQSNKTGVWDSSYAMVQHLPNGTTLSATDSTSNANNGTISGPTAGGGLIDGGGTNNGTLGNVISVANSASLSGLAHITLSYWFKTTTTTAGQGSTAVVALGKHSNSTNGEWYLTLGGATATNNQANFTLINSSPTRVNLVASLGTTYTDGNWHYLTGTYDGSTMTVYFDGSSKATTSQSGTINAVNDYVGIFDYAGALSTNNSFNGSMDEVRVSNVSRSADYILTCFNNQSAPTSFYSTVPQ